MTVKEKIALFPHSPGVYRYYDSEGKVIYVGKAKDLHKRVAQYFVPQERLNAKTRALVAKIADAQYSVVDSEADALLLENNLIKQYKPKYNILLKDSKTYPWVCVTGDEFPKVFITRRVDKSHGNRYFGPYSSVMHARNLVDFFKELYPLRSCNLKITSEAILRHKFRPCLDFHIGRCKGCCIGKISKDEYNGWIDEIVRLLTGRGGEIIQHYKALMQEAAESLDFESAQIYKDKIQSLEKHYSKSVITSVASTNADVFSLVFDGMDAFGNFLRIRGGSQPLDETSVHPESYEAVAQLLKGLGLAMNRESFRAAASLITDPAKKAAELGIGEPTLRDILGELEKPARDPREDMPAPVLRSDVLSMEDLAPGMKLKGTVRNIVDFGAFVDIGVHQDGLVHISKMSRKFIKHPLEAVRVGDVVEVTVLGVDAVSKRISLSMVEE